MNNEPVLLWLKPGNTVDLGEIPMQPGVTIFGVITDEASNKAVKGATIKFVDFNRKKVIQTKSQADGSYILPSTAMDKIKEDKLKYLNLLNDHAIQFMEMGIRFYESSVKKSENYNISNEYVLEAKKRLYGLRY